MHLTTQPERRVRRKSPQRQGAGQHRLPPPKLPRDIDERFLTGRRPTITPVVLAMGLRRLEDQVLRTISGDVFTLQLAYRLICRFLRRNGRMPAFVDLPDRFTSDLFDRPRAVPRSREKRRINGMMFGLLLERVEAAVLPRPADDAAYTLRPPTNVLFRDPRLERRRREVIYRKQWEQIERAMNGGKDDPRRRGPKAVPILCVDTGDEFPSARAAAAWINAQYEAKGDPKRAARADLRTALRRNTRCGGFRWQYVQGAVAAFVSTGRERPVRCVETGKPYPCQSDAARAVGVSPTTLAEAITAGTRLRCPDGRELTFERIEPESPSAPVYMEQPQRLSAVA